MTAGTSSSTTARRNRMIAIAVGAITIIAIVLGFAGDFLGLPWHWMRPAAELLLLAELVGLVVLERHQLFEPVSEKVAGIETRLTAMGEMLAAANLQRMSQSVDLITDQISTSAHTILYPTAPELLRGMARTARDALAREQSSPQILYFTRLSGPVPRAIDDPEFSAELKDGVEAFLSFKLLPGSPPDAKQRRWSMRGIAVYPDQPSHEAFTQFLPAMVADNPLNLELKLLVGPRLGAQLTPELVTDRDAILTFNDAVASFRWGVCFRGAEYRALVGRWLDDLWASIPDRYLVYSRNGLNQKALDIIRDEAEAAEASRSAKPT